MSPASPRGAVSMTALSNGFRTSIFLGLSTHCPAKNIFIGRAPAQFRKSAAVFLRTVAAEKAPAVGTVIGGPARLLLRHQRLDTLNLPVEVVEIMQYQRLDRLRQLGRAELVLAVMAHQHMFDEHGELVGEIRDRANLLTHLLDFHDEGDRKGNPLNSR